jgi:hypothetical protein
LNFEGEVLFEIFDNHDQEWQFYCERFLGVNWAGDVVGADICSHDFKDG